MPISCERVIYNICEYGYFDVEGKFHCPFAENIKEPTDISALDSSLIRSNICPKYKRAEDIICYKVKVKED